MDYKINVKKLLLGLMRFLVKPVTAHPMLFLLIYGTKKVFVIQSNCTLWSE